MMQEQGTISIHTENIFPIIKKFLYSDNEIFLRELVSNAVDATQKMKRLASLGEYNQELGNTTIQVKLDKEAKTITISDKGIGMTAEEIKKYINQVAFSGATEFVEKYKEAKDAQEIIGKFGLGFYSAFMVADLVEINTLSYQEEAQAAKWTCDGSTSFTIDAGDRTERGTDIILHINEESEEFLSEGRIEEILKKYAQFLPVSIQFGTRTQHEPDGEDEEGNTKYKEIEVPNIINNTEPLWTKNPSDLKDEDYLDFYRELYPMSEDPLFWIHLNVDYPFELTGILYFPKVQNEFELQKNKIKLFSRQVFITDDVQEIVPEFLMLLHGVIDSPDIPLNVSRSFLQSDGNVKKINSYITRKVADKLQELFKEDRKSYEEKWSDIGLFVKYGMLSDDKFYDKAKNFCLLQNTEKENFTLDEYKEKVAPLQTDKNEQLVYLYANDVNKQYQYIKAAEQKNYDVLLMNSPIDQHFIGFLEQKLEKTSLKRVDADLIQNLIEKEEEFEKVLNEDQEKQVIEIYKNTINNEHMEVKVTAQSPNDPPVTITMDEFMRRMKDMSKMGGGGMMNFYGTLPDKYNVNINANHPIMQDILNKNDEDSKQIAKQSFDLALLAQNMLDGQALSDFIERSVELMKKK
ncbi:MAG TPA: molecular chaperone HtpG [Chitinophagaceae bacterium]|nr:molecular chaperone HtpG [Chitinophagaceae bacterium]